MTYFDRMKVRKVNRPLAKASQPEPGRERVYKDDDLVHSTLGTIRRTAAEKRALDDFADRHLRLRI